MRPRRFLLRLSTLAFIVCMLASCTSEPVKKQQQPSTEGPPEPIMQDAAEEEGQVITLVTPETSQKAPEEKSKYQIHTRLTDFHLLSETTGIAWGITNASLRLYQTQDYGETWMDISPSSNVEFGSKLVYGKDIVFTDKDHGWIIRNMQGSTETVLLHTSDGGKSWKISALPKSGTVTALSFVSSEQGWIMASGSSSKGLEEKLLYRTNDGIVWHEVMQNTEYPRTRIPGTVIPRTGSMIGMRFTNPQVGFATVQELQSSKLYITRDGGSQWKSSAQVFQSDSLDRCGSVYAGTPQALGFVGEEVYIPVVCMVKDAPKYMGYFTADAGRSWNLVSFPMTGDPNKGSIQPVFRRLHDGWAMVHGIVYHTTDMGRNWKPYPRDELLTSNLKKYPKVVKMQFISSDVGWLLIETEDKKRSRLMMSTDGGVSWQGL